MCVSVILSAFVATNIIYATFLANYFPLDLPHPTNIVATNKTHLPSTHSSFRVLTSRSPRDVTNPVFISFIVWFVLQAVTCATTCYRHLLSLVIGVCVVTQLSNAMSLQRPKSDQSMVRKSTRHASMTSHVTQLVPVL